MKIVKLYVNKYINNIKKIKKVKAVKTEEKIKRKYKLLIIAIVFFVIISYVFFKTYSRHNIVTNELSNVSDNIIEEDVDDLDLIKQKYNENKLIALTFDDGPSSYTKLLIDGLKERNVNVTFFILGENIYKHPEYIKEAYDNGNEIEIHGYTHKQFTKLTNDKIIAEIDKVNMELIPIIGEKPNLIRVPYGSINNRIKELLASIGMQNILWTVDSKDWKFLNTKKNYNYLISKIKGNSIVLMHDTYKPSVNAALMIIDTLKEEGYMFVTVDEYIKCINE